MAYVITKSDGTTLTTINPYETNGPGSVSSPFQVACGLQLTVLSATAGVGFVIAGNVQDSFSPGFVFTISGGTPNDGSYVVNTSTFMAGQTYVLPTTPIVTSAASGTVQLRVFLVKADLVNVAVPRFVAGASFDINLTAGGTGPNTGTYTVQAGESAVYDTANQWTVIPSTEVITQYDTNPFMPSQYSMTYTVPASSTLVMTGKDSVDWGIKIWENMVHMTEHFANSSGPANPIQGQIWFNTASGYFNYWNGSAWVDLSAAVGGVDSIQMVGPGPTYGPLKTGNTQIDAADIAFALGYVPGSGSGSVTSVNATGSTGLTVGGGPITTSGTLTLTLASELQAFSNITAGSGGQFLRRAAGPTYTYGNLTSGEVTTALGFTPGTVTSVSAGSGMTGGPITSSGSLSVDSTQVPYLFLPNTFTGANTFSPYQTFTAGLITPFINYTSTLTFYSNGGGIPVANFDSTGNLTVGNASGGHVVTAPKSTVDVYGAIRSRPIVYNGSGGAVNVTINNSLSNVFRIYNATSITLNNPTTAIDGQVITVVINQGPFGTSTISSIGGQWRFPGVTAGVPPVIAQGTNQSSTITAVYDGTAGVWRASIVNSDAISTGFAQSLLSTGWQRLPTGLIIQWGTDSVVGNHWTDIAFPIPYTTFSRVMTTGGPSGDDENQQDNNPYTQSSGTTTFRVYNARDNAITIFWISVGV